MEENANIDGYSRCEGCAGVWLWTRTWMMASGMANVIISILFNSRFFDIQAILFLRPDWLSRLVHWPRQSRESAESAPHHEKFYSEISHFFANVVGGCWGCWKSHKGKEAQENIMKSQSSATNFFALLLVVYVEHAKLFMSGSGGGGGWRTGNGEIYHGSHFYDVSN